VSLTLICLECGERLPAFAVTMGLNRCPPCVLPIAPASPIPTTAPDPEAAAPIPADPLEDDTWDQWTDEEETGEEEEEQIRLGTVTRWG
jgi:hypothetical protein